MKYKLINKTTKEEHLCDKVTIDGFDYYVSDELPKLNDVVITSVGNIHYIKDNSKDFIEYISKLGKKIIATTSPNIDIPKVVDEVEELSEKFIGCKYEDIEDSIDQIGYDSFKRGYNKSQETHPFSEEDMIEFAEWRRDFEFTEEFSRYEKEELLQVWKEQQPKIVYYE